MNTVTLHKSKLTKIIPNEEKIPDIFNILGFLAM